MSRPTARIGKASDVSDYVIVGGGSGGCTLAGRLSEDSSASVTLLEKGPRDWNPYIHLPVTYYKTATGSLLTRYAYNRGDGQPPLEQATMVQARVLGGGSSVNAMVYVRGVPGDYDGWEAAGAAGWGYRDVLPYFKRAEDNERLLNDVHGVGGPLGVSDPRHIHPLSRRWLQACQQAGLPWNDDFNSGDQKGCGFYQITARDGRRSSAATAYLKPARGRPNLSIRTGCRVLRLIVEKGTAVGVEFLQGGERKVLRAAREVVLSAGAFGSPKLLMQSGIGPADHLRAQGVAVIHDLPGVGQNYQDHMEMSLVYNLSGPHSYDKYKKLHWKLWAGLHYALFRSGPVTSNVIESGAFWWSDKKDVSPDIQLFCVVGAGVEEGVPGVPGGNGCTISVTQTRPKSRGTVELRGSDPLLPPSLSPNYLSDPYDVDCMIDGARLVQDIMGQSALQGMVSSSHVPPAPLKTRADFEAFVRTEAHPGLHPCGTCRMGTDAMAVVDPHLRLRGIENLRVADASVMPNVISGNLNAVVIMIGEKASDLMRGLVSPVIAQSASIPAVVRTPLLVE